MSALPADLDPLLTDLRAALEDLYGDRLVRLVLYGSRSKTTSSLGIHDGRRKALPGAQARGDTHPESDVDVLVVLEGDVEPGREIRRMSAVAFQVGLEHEGYVSTLPVSESKYRPAPSDWLKNVRKEGMSL